MIWPDRAYVISLPFREDRREFLKEELSLSGIDFEIWWALSHTDGKIGLLQTMKFLFRYCLTKGFKNVLVLEDDVRFLVKDVNGFLNNVMPQLPADYHMFYLGLNLTSPPTLFSQNLLKINSAYSTHAIMYSRKGMELALAELEKDEPIPYDILLMQRLQPLSGSYASYPMLASQRVSYSDIDNVDRDWGNLMSITYSMHTKKLFMEQPIPCKVEHTWNGVAPHVDPNRHENQFPELHGKPCDCGKVKILQESACGCQGNNNWQLVVVQNT